ncbi:MAG: hypothetical protein HY791_10505 [Deltaproteobacteria bacterium]|nr:hypothetical protein [Deltaproteobacteria bacterium]
MRRTLLSAIIPFVLLTGNANAEPCGAVTEAGECRGNVVAYCDQATMELATVDCVADVDPGAICMTIDSTYGVDCALPAAAECLGQDKNGDYVSMFCQGTNPGCLDTLDAQTCFENLGPCTADDEGTCNGDQLLVVCNVNQPWVIDCLTYDARCENGACVGAPENGYCDDTVLCDVGLECDTSGSCVSAVTTDAGATVDSGTSVDSGTPGVDTGIPANRDASTNVDAGVPGLLDTGAKSAKTTKPTTESGCSCAETSRPRSYGALALSLLVCCARRFSSRRARRT